MRRIARSGCEPGTRPSSSAYENSNPDLSSIPRINPIRLASTRGNHANETKERTFSNILLKAHSLLGISACEGGLVLVGGGDGANTLDGGDEREAAHFRVVLVENEGVDLAAQDRGGACGPSE